mmetsp:Transcript_1325/g.1804  ORF Transcript_1325/g.1804 Transcript_1325/m.1804 type:complete len:199 (-) Transcript_1325:685-1281(-)
MNDMPLSHPGGQPFDSNIHAPADHSAATIDMTGITSGVPLPKGLIPVGNAVSATKNSTKPPQGSTRVKAGGIGMSAQYDPLPWTDFFDSVEKINDMVPIYTAGTEGHIFVCLHGAGHSAMSFASFAEKMKATGTVIAFDWRGHGDHAREDESNMSQETLIADAIEVLQYVHQKHTDRSLILVGHSMGGAMATKIVSHV